MCVGGWCGECGVVVVVGDGVVDWVGDVVVGDVCVVGMFVVGGLC